MRWAVPLLAVLGIHLAANERVAPAWRATAVAGFQALTWLCLAVATAWLLRRRPPGTTGTSGSCCPACRAPRCSRWR
ncbi:MAG TPA: hypothetical protein VFW27_08740 [Actinoplanes sp.]|nr:hypothetical protein [Actinoplanes sp.]